KIVIIGFVCVRVGLAYLLAIHLGLGLVGAWVAMVVDLFARGYLIQRRFNRGDWKNLKI
ncbi:MAG TPA: MATE family efflux transporter, partial [Firmicutes bacterium]|nr:MATE family efflux transporter [Bacillota bacterium]